MKLFKNFLRDAYYFEVGFNATVQDCKNNVFTKKNTKRVLRSTLSVVLIASMLTVGGCSSRSSTQSSSSEAESSSEAQSSSSAETLASSSAASSQPPVELAAGATRYEPIASTDLLTTLKERAKKHEEETVAATPTIGDLEGWKKKNPDTVGWINIPGTNIDYPILYRKDTNYYTARGYYGEPSKNGVIWLDGDTRFAANGDFASTNTVIYGHNWTNCWRPVRVGNPADVMLGQMASYDNAEFAKTHPDIYIKTPGGTHTYKVMTIFYVDLATKNYPKFQYAELKDMSSMVNQAIKLSVNDFGVPYNQGDKLITFSTCTRILREKYDGQRMVLMAKLVS